MKKLYVSLSGGLGNQMFQYATASAMAKRTGSQLILDTISGFVRDNQYNRFYELGNLPIIARAATFNERLPIWLFRIDRKIRNRVNDIHQEFFYGNFLIENKNKFIKEVVEYNNDSNTWLIGYWQSYLYFQDYSWIISKELKPPIPTLLNYQEIGKQMNDCESVAIGIRMYEESKNPSAHTSFGYLKSAVEINSAIRRLRSLISNVKFFIFCSKRTSFLNQLELPKNSIFLTRDDGFDGTMETLWLLSMAKHHIFTCSSFYWWGAWLSKYNESFLGENQIIFAGDNFINADGLLHDWKKF